MDALHYEYYDTDEYDDVCREFHQDPRINERNSALEVMQFPGEFRPNQRELSHSVYRQIVQGGTLLLEAPTGLGKSLGVLFPALKAMPRSHLDKLFVLTMRTTGREAILNDLKYLISSQSTPTPLRVLELSARNTLCQRPEGSCSKSICDRVKANGGDSDSAFTAALDETWMDQACVIRIAKRYRVCPYALSQSLILEADVIIADVNLFFSRHAQLYTLATEHNWHISLLVDECHNLIDRIRAMYSETLTFDSLSVAAVSLPPQLQASSRSVINLWQHLTHSHINHDAGSTYTQPTEYELDPAPLNLYAELRSLCCRIRDLFPVQPLKPTVQDFYFKAESFLDLIDVLGDEALHELKVMRAGTDEFPFFTSSLSLHLMVPAGVAAKRFLLPQSNILFSATLNPPDYYRDLLGLPVNTQLTSIQAPYSADQIELQIHNIDTRYDSRPLTLQPIAECIEHQYHAEPGNYLIFLSSMTYLNQLHDEFRNRCPDIETICQTQEMSHQARLHFIDQFKNQRGLVGFALLGGIFAEGVDLPGDNLIGVGVVTLSLQPRTTITKALSRRYGLMFGEDKVFQYTYLYPAICKVCQAAGRLIRTSTDTGTIMLFDLRYSNPEIQALLPEWWFRHKT